MKVSREFWLFGGEDGEGFAEVVFHHEGLEVGERLLVGLGLPDRSVVEEADGWAAEQSQHQQPIATPGPASVLVERPTTGTGPHLW
jgi:hypothetical protein